MKNKAEPDSAVITQALLDTAKTWLDSYRNPAGVVRPGTTATGLTVTTHLIRHFPLGPDEVSTKSQIKGSSGEGVARVLAAFGEERTFLSEGGRTSRQNRDRGLTLAEMYNDGIGGMGFERLSTDERTPIVDTVLSWFVVRLQEEYFSKLRIKIDVDHSAPASSSVSALLEAGIKQGGNSAGAVAQHLVGAKLALRFPDEVIGNDGYTTADRQTKRQGDFTVGDTAFHVTMRPTAQLMERRCRENLSHGFRAVVLVPENMIPAANNQAELAQIAGKISVIGIEKFVGMNIEEMAEFRGAGVRRGLRRLLETYNERVKAVEPDPSLLINIPKNL